MLVVFLPVIVWSFRYYALAALLLWLAIIGVKTFIQNREEKRGYKTTRVILKAFGMMVLIFVFTLPAILFPQNKVVVDATGDNQELTKTYTYIDQNRIESYTDTGENRKLNVQWWYPEHLEQTYPLIIFSHGGLGVKTSNESLFNELASHGFVVCSIDHTYQCFYTTDEDGKTTLIDFGYMQELFAENPLSDIQQSYEFYQKWMKIRTEDINFVIDYIAKEALTKNADLVYKLVDMSRIGVMGHSLGGSAALGIGRIRDDVHAVIALESPFMYDIEGIVDDRFFFTDEIYPIPVLNIYSDSSWNILSLRPQYEKNYTMLSETNSTVFTVHISGIGHLGLTDFALTSPLLTHILDRKKSTTEKTLYVLKTINKLSLEFFNQYLKEDGEFTPKRSY
ncbi:MAG: alpha/beta hydrolase [Thermotogota bacterium]|nr:alpha/beta hydrolase [Thermotogota bacterium]